MELKDDLLKEMKESLHGMRVSTLVPLVKDKEFKLSLLGEMKVNGKPAVGVKVECKGHRDLNLYFDKESGLLVRSEGRGLNPVTMQEGTMETTYSDFKEQDGLKDARKVSVLMDGKKFVDAEVIEMKHLDKVEETEFAKPG